MKKNYTENNEQAQPEPICVYYTLTCHTAEPRSRHLMSGLIEPLSRSPNRLEPLSPSDTVGQLTRTHLQGSEVDKDGYYETLIANDYRALRVKTGWNPQRQGPATVKVGSGNPNRNYSSISMGDRLYFSGSHMYQTHANETSQTGLDKANGGQMSQNAELLTTTRLGGCTKAVRSPRSPKFGSSPMSPKFG